MNTQNNNSICKICNKSYAKLGHLSAHIHNVHNLLYKDYYDQYLKIDNDGKCKICNYPTIFYKGKYRNYCSKKCQNTDPINIQKNSDGVRRTKSQSSIEDINKSNKKRNETCLTRYGKENISQLDQTKEQVYQTNIEKYGDWFLNTPECKKLFENKYGCKNAQQVEKVKEKTQQTCLKKYGSISPLCNKDIKTNIRQIRYKNLYAKLINLKDSVIPLFTEDEYQGRNHIYKWKCVKCGTIFDQRYNFYLKEQCPKCYPAYSKEEIKIYEVLKGLNNTIQSNRRLIIKPFELDYYIEDKNIAIEYNGLYWHSEINGKKDKFYHLFKTELCEQKNIRLIQIFEDEWLKNQKNVINRIKNILGLIKRSIYARKCEIKEIDSNLKNRFLDKYHIQGRDISNINLGCYYQNHLVAVMTFSKLRIALGAIHHDKHYELSRFCSIHNFNIIGGAGKLLSFFEKNYKPILIKTFADRRWSQGQLYYKLGFQLHHISKPNYWYVPYGGKRRYHRFNFRKNILKDKLPIFDNSLSEWQNMKNNQYDRIWDCGNYVFHKNYN